MSKHDKIAKLKEYIKNFVIKELEKDEEIDEASTTASAGAYHYDTPYAFYGGRKKDKEKKKKISHAGGYKPVNESYSGMFIEISKAIKVNRPDELNAIRDLADEYDIGRVLYMARTNPKGLKKAVDDRVKERKQFIKGKNLKELKEALTAKGVNQFKKSIKLLGQFVNQLDREIKKPKGKRNDQEIINLINVGSATFNGLSKLLKDKSINEGRYHDWRNDESLTPKQKIGQSMREIRDALNELDKTVKMNLKLKTELKMKSEDYWKNTHKALTKISERLVKMANKVGNLK